MNLVVLHASVVGERGQFVPGLKQDDFRVFEDLERDGKVVCENC